MSNKGNPKKSPNYEMMAKILGCVSIGLGLAEIFAPRQVSKLIGIEDKHRDLLRSMGVREIINGVGILMNKHPSNWVWSRVGGDILDLGLMGLAFKTDKVKHARLATAMSTVAGVAAADLYCGSRLTRRLGPGEA